MKKYYMALVYNDPNKFKAWLEDKKKTSSEFSYDVKAQTVTVSIPNHGVEVWKVFRYLQEDNWAVDRFNCLQLYYFHILDGFIKAEHISYMMTRLRGGIKEI